VAAGDITLRVDLGPDTARILDLAQQAVTSLEALHRKVDTLASQEQVDALAARLTSAADQIGSGQAALSQNVRELAAAVGELQAEIQSLKDAGAPVDLTGLTAAADKVDQRAAGITAAVQDVTAGVDDVQALAGEPPAPPVG